MPDWDRLREQSILPGGFGKQRAAIWPEALHVDTSRLPAEDISSQESRALQPHRDERQIVLDTDRSFVLYPVAEVQNKDEMKANLNNLVVSVFRRHPRLNYFQGYHDIISVLFLTLPPDVQLLCAEKMSLYRLRDSMGQSLEPVVGLLRVLKNLIGLADPEYAVILNRGAPLPYHALSNLLTLFSHDVSALPLIQHIFDFLLVRPPIAAVYLDAAIVLCRKEEIYRLEKAEEEEMFHPLLTSLPELYDEMENDLDDDDEKTDINNEDSSIALELSEKRESDLNGGAIISPAPKEELEDTKAWESIDESISGEVPGTSEHTHVAEMVDPTSDTLVDAVDASAPLESLISSPSCDATFVNDKFTLDKDHNPSINHLADSFEDHVRHHRTRVSLTSLLCQADDLYRRFPPSHPDLHLRSIMGPKSVIFTWSETPAALFSEPEAEAIVDELDSVVLPYVDLDERPPQRRPRRVARRSFGASLRRSGMEKRILLAGAVLVLSAIMALYGIRSDAHRGHRHEWKKIARWIVGLLLGRWTG